MQNLKKLYQIIKPAKWLMLIITALAISEVLLGLVTPFIYKFLINNITDFISGNISRGIAVSNLYQIIGYSVVVFLVSSITHSLQNYFSPKLTARSMQLIREKFFEHISFLSIDFFEKEKAGKTISMMNRGVSRGGMYIRNLSQWLIAHLLLGLTSIIIIIILNPLIGFIMLVSVGIYLITTKKMVKALKPLHKKINKTGDLLSAKSVDVISGMHTVRSFAQEENELNLYKKTSNSQVNLEVKRGKKRSQYFFGRHTVVDFAKLIIIIIVAFQALDKQITPGDIFLYLAYINYIIWPLNQIIYLYDDGQEAMRSVDDIIKVLETKPSVKDKKGAKKLKKIEGKIEFKNVDFSYNKSKETLKNVNFKIDTGKIVALVGPSGTGKTTITKLIARFYDAKKGEVIVDGLNVKDVTQKSLRENIGVVMQDVMLFNDTINNNIRYGSSKAKKEDIINAAKSANIHDFIMTLPKKYNTIVGERGIKLSGGEKQRVAIARAILKNPSILILDEATSSLDSHSEMLVQEALWKLIKNRTTVIIAHRLATVMKADKILVLDKGAVTEAGTHKELVKKGGLYAMLFKIQSGAMLISKDD